MGRKKSEVLVYSFLYERLADLYVESNTPRFPLWSPGHVLLLELSSNLLTP
jgi:hypothetical protein